jgi:hypothetical protein
MRRFISSFKQYTAFHYKKKYGRGCGKLISTIASCEKKKIFPALQAIFLQPVRKRIVDDYREYRFLGSFEFDQGNLKGCPTEYP